MLLLNGFKRRIVLQCFNAPANTNLLVAGFHAAQKPPIVSDYKQKRRKVLLIAEDKFTEYHITLTGAQ